MRRQAEAKLSERKKKAAALPAPETDTQRLIHELEVHQIELEMQNEELVQSRTQVEVGLRQYTDLYDFAPVGYFTLALDGAIHQVNLAGANLLGVEHGALIKRRFGVFVSARSRTTFSAFLEKVFSTSGSKETCEIALQEDGSAPLWAHIEAMTEDGQRKTCRAVVVDITERKQAEEALRDNEMLFRKLFEDHAAVKLIINPDTGNIIAANEAAAVFYGWSCEQLKKMKIQEINTLSPEEIKKELEKARTQKKIHFEFRHRRADGSVRDVDVFSSKIEVKGKDLLHSIVHDITDRKLAEKQLRESLEQLRRAMQTTIQVLVRAVEMKDPYTAGHQRRATNLARTIATEMGLPSEKIEGLRMAGVIHDIGKITLPTEILSKPKKLDAIELSLIREHVRLGYDILKDVESPWPLAEIVLQHHERMDGSGYPGGLKGEEILMEARILAVADVVEAMASHRPYRPALGIDAALEEIEKNRGLLYDADAVDACLRVFREKGYQIEGA
jgi:PAS domain S-box-containing protein